MVKAHGVWLTFCTESGTTYFDLLVKTHGAMWWHSMSNVATPTRAMWWHKYGALLEVIARHARVGGSSLDVLPKAYACFLDTAVSTSNQ